MKKILSLFIAFLILTLPSCGKNYDFEDITTKDMNGMAETAPSSGTEKPDGADTDETLTTLPSSEDTNSGAAANISVSYQTYAENFDTKGKSAYVKYPVLAGTGNDEEINALVKSEILGKMSADLVSLFDDTASFWYWIDNVTPTFLNESLASFLFTGIFYAEGSMHPTSFVYTVNLDIGKCRLLDTENIVSNVFGLSELYNDGATFSLTSYANEDIKKEIEESSDKTLTSLTPVYFIEKDGEKYLAVSVQTIHALGDYACYMAKLSEVEDTLFEDILKLTKGRD